ncbi:MAG: hypothetical protein Q9183_004168, partial [Haloplaca sp. 2 TL-2023]
RGNDARKEKVHHNTAEELGLHAPFRSFASRGADEGLVLQNDDGRRKRRRSHSTESSSLKPAVQAEESEQESEGVEDTRTYKTSHATRKRRGERPSSPILVSDLQEKPSKTYERRKRHKTREDRYELKQGAKRPKPQKTEKEAGAKPKRKKKHIQKSGSALMQDFNAGNIQPDRLTLKSKKPLGLFGRGRASSPVRRNGCWSSISPTKLRADLDKPVPDLTFSELGFLNRRKAPPKENQVPTGEKARRKKDKAADAEAEISRFFASSKDQHHGARHETSDKGRTHGNRRGEQENTPLPPVDLPERHFLGFGGHGAVYGSPVISRDKAASQKDSRVSPLQRSPSGRSTTYFTWSESNPSKYARSSGGGQSLYVPASDRSGTSRIPSRRARGPSLDLPNIIHHGNHGSLGRSPVSALRQDLDNEQEPIVNGEGPGAAVHSPDNTPSRSGPEHHKRPAVMESTKCTQKQTGHNPDTNASPENAEFIKPDLASMIATHARPEVLGAILDALLNKVSYADRTGGQGPPRSASQLMANDQQVQGLGDMRPCKEHDIHLPSPRHAERNHTLMADAQADLGQGQGSQQPQPQPSKDLSWQENARVLNEGPGFEQPHQHERNKSLDQRLQWSHQGFQRIASPQITELRPKQSNENPGYCNLYQSQMNTSWEHGQDYQEQLRTYPGSMDGDYNQADNLVNRSRSKNTERSDGVREKEHYDDEPVAPPLVPYDDLDPVDDYGRADGFYPFPQEIAQVDGLDFNRDIPTEGVDNFPPYVKPPTIFQGLDHTLDTPNHLDPTGFLGGRGFVSAHDRTRFLPWSLHTPEMAREGG